MKTIPSIPIELWSQVLEHARPTPFELKALTLLDGPSSNKKGAGALQSLVTAARDAHLAHYYILADVQAARVEVANKKTPDIQAMALRTSKASTSSWAEFDRRMYLKPVRVRRRIVQAYKQPSAVKPLQRHEFEWVRADADLTVAYGYAYQQIEKPLPQDFFPILFRDQQPLMEAINAEADKAIFQPNQALETFFPFLEWQTAKYGPLCLASKPLKENKAIAIEAIKQNLGALRLIGSSVLRDPDVTDAIVANPQALTDLFSDLQQGIVFGARQNTLTRPVSL